MTYFVSENVISIIIGLSAFSVIVFIMALVALIKVRKLRSMYKKFLGGSRKSSIEEMLLDHHNYVRSIDERYSEVQSEIRRLYEKNAFAIQKIGMIRYNPFDNVGGNLCYALALLNDHNNGVIINTIYGRDGSYNYGKPIINGECEIALSEEEKEALKIALKSRT